MASISNNAIARAIYLAAKEENGTPEFSKKVVRFLAKRRLLSKSPDILSRLEVIADTEEGNVRVTVTSAERLDMKTKEELIRALAKRHPGKNVILEELLDRTLLGGIKIEVGDEVIDLSVRNRLTQLQKHLTKSA